MIVTCTQCQTRFKVPDEKIPPRGVRVRCSKCHQTFQVTRSLGAPAAADDGAPQSGVDVSDPFGLSAPPPPPAPAPAPYRAPPAPVAPAPSYGAVDFDFGEPMQAPPPPAPPAPAFSPFEDDPVPAAGDAAPDRSLFDMPAPSAAPAPSSGGLLDEIPDLPGEAPASIVASAAPAATRAAVPIARITRPSLPAVAGPPPIRFGTRVVRTFVGAALLVLLLGLVGVVINGGRIPRWEAVLKSSPAGAMETRDVSSGLYETPTGKAVFFVRGEVHNRGTRSSRAVVDVELPPGVQPSGKTRFWAGSVATPEDLSALNSEADAAALVARLSQGAQAVAPGASASFFALFYDVAEDALEPPVRVRATAEDSGAAPSPAVLPPGAGAMPPGGGTGTVPASPPAGDPVVPGAAAAGSPPVGARPPTRPGGNVQ